MISLRTCKAEELVSEIGPAALVALRMSGARAKVLDPLSNPDYSANVS
jgi:hypothetical protein